MTKSKRLTPQGENFDALTELFAPFVITAATEEVDRLLKNGFTLERLNACISYVEGYDAARVKKAVLLHMLKKRRKILMKGGHVSLSKREYTYILKAIRTSLPARTVRCWIVAVCDADIAPLSAFDEAMLPPGAEISLYKKAFEAFGIETSALRRIFSDIRKSESPLPSAVIAYLTSIGLIDDLS